MAGASAGAEAVERAHGLYRGGRHREALELYSAALAAARGPAQRIALHSNRAACYLKLHDFHKAAQECTSVLELDTEHAGALMLRAQTLVTLKDYQSALFDVNRLIEINPSSEVYRNLQARLKTQLSLAPIPECEEESLCLEEEKEELPPRGQKIETSIAKPDQPATELVLKNTPSTGPILDRKPAAEPLKAVTELVLENKPSTGPILDRKPAAEPLKAVTELVLENKFSTGQILNRKPATEPPSTLPSKPLGWEAIPKPKGHSGLDYSKWDKVEDDSSEDEDDDEEDELPQYKFKVRTVGVRSVK